MIFKGHNSGDTTPGEEQRDRETEKERSRLRQRQRDSDRGREGRDTELIDT